ncbi:hypothetical protein LCGC14_2640100 [marine sediment metagenome]|uniref:Uncharacterized protein n=1 Tax=marine sediment metagenome TaxID=412755 RepID=A0A0F8ZXX7_9ZZZZ
MELTKKKLLNIIEPVMFNEKELLELKELINNVGSNEVEPKQLRNAIIDNRMSIMERLVDIFFFQVSREITMQEINNFTGNDTRLKVEIEEKNTLLEQIAERIQNIHAKAVEKLGPID